MWKRLTLTTAGNTARLGFKGRGSIYAEGNYQLDLAGSTGATVNVYYSEQEDDTF